MYYYINISRFLSLFISLSLLIAPLPLSAIAQEIISNDILFEHKNYDTYAGDSYIYLNKELSNIAEIISQLSDIDEDKNSPLHALNKHIKNGFSLAECDAVVETLMYAEKFLQKNFSQLNKQAAEKIATDLDTIIDKVIDGSLTRSPYKTIVVPANMNVLGKTTLKKHLNTKEGAHIQGHLKVNKSAKFKNNVKVKGTLSVADVVVKNCINNLCVNNFSAQDATIENLTLTGPLVFTDLTVTNLSVTNTLSANDAVIQDLTVAHCMTNVCVEHLSVTDEVVQDFLRFQDSGSNYVGIQAPSVVPTNYTVSLPSATPTANQILRANAVTPTNLEWFTQGGSVLPAASKTIYVTKYGNDITGDGSFSNPYASLAKAITVANGLSSSINPITIFMGTGIYIENNSVGPLTITADGISIVGDSPTGVVILPNTPANNFLLINNAIQIVDMTFQSSAPLATGITLSSVGLSVFENVYVYNFFIGVDCTGSVTSAYGFNNCLFIANNIALNINNVHAECNSSTFFGSSSLVGPAANTGVRITGSDANVVIDGGVIGVCTTGLNVTNNAIASIAAVSFRINTFDVVQDGASHLTLSGCTFELTDGPSDIDVQISGAGTIANIISCKFDGKNVAGTSEGTGIVIYDNAFVNIGGGTINNYVTGIHLGVPADTSSTNLSASALVIDNCTTDIIQEGSSSLNLNGSTATSDKISINDATNVSLAFFDLDDKNALTIGSTADQNTSLLIANVIPGDMVEIDYLSSLYSTKAIGFRNHTNNPSSWYMLSNDTANITSISTDRTKISGLRLVSDEGSPIGGTSALRGWDINKNGSAAELSFNYQNSDIVGQIAIPQYTVMQLDGLNNQLQLPTAGTQIVFDADTNLYRDSANVLKTDDNFIVGTLTPDRVVVTDAITNQLASSAVTGTELGYLSGVTAPIQTQLNGKVNRSGDTMTGPLSATDIVVTNLTATTLSSTDAIIQNASITTLSVTDEVIQNIQATNISVVDETVTGTLSVNDEVIKNFLRFQDSGSNYVGVQAPTVVPTSYTVSLPSTAPTINQTLRAGSVTATDLTWVTEGGSTSPVNSKTIYVAKYGNDITGNGSLDTPYLTLSKAITVANGLASAVNPITILISSGIYVENNSAGPLMVTATGISIVGDAVNSVIIMPSTPANNLLTVNNNILIATLTLQSSLPLATGISLTAGSLSALNNIRVINFLVGVSCSGSATDSYRINNAAFILNGTAINIDDTFLACDNTLIFGNNSFAGPAVNTGISVTGSNARVSFNAGLYALCTTGCSILNNATVNISDINFRFNTYDIIQSGGSNMTLSGCTFAQTTSGSDSDVQINGLGTTARILSCAFNGNSPVNTPEGTGIFISDNATVTITACTIDNYTTGIHIGVPADTASTKLFVSGSTINNCTTDILQEGLATFDFDASISASNKINFNDSTNINLAFFDLDDNGALAIGSLTDKDTTLLQAATTLTNHPRIDYKSSLYSTQAIGFTNPQNNPSTWFMLSNDESHVTGVTTDRTKISGLRLVSDEGSPVGGTSALRGWDINKNGSAAELSFNYQNSDIVGQIAIPQYTVMQLDGFNNQLQLPTAGTQIVFDTDTNLYRDSANVLKTDDNFIVGTLTPDRVVVTDAITNQLASSAVTGTELGYLSGVTSPIQTQLNGKVAKAGDIMTGTLQLPAGTTALPSLTFTGSTTTGLSAPVANSLAFSTNAVERMKIDSTGVISIDAFGTAGVVHNDASGNLSSSLIVNTDITNATISNAKLATIASTDTPGNIVVRDGSGNFATNMITIDGTTSNATDVATKAYVDAAVSTGLVVHPPALVVSTTDTAITGLYSIDGVSLSANDRVLLVNQTITTENGLWLAQAGAWTRPADFATGTAAGEAYVLVTSGSANAGSSYLCNTPTAIIDTDPISFALFSLPDTTTGANVGAGTGLVFKNKSGITLNFRSLLSDTHMAITTNADDITIGTDATDVNTPSTIVARDGSGNFSAGTITASLTGAASLNVLKSGDTMTGTLTIPAGTTSVPSLTFTGSTTTGFSANSDDLSISTGGIERMKIDSTGIVSIDMFNIPGVVHNDASGNLSSSLIINADVDPTAAIVDTKLATISTAGKVANSATTATSLNTANAIVARDGSGNFTATTIIADLMGSASNNVLKAGDTMTGTLQLPAGTTALPSLVFTGSTTTGLSTNTGDLSFSTSALERMKISSGGTISIDAFTLAGIVHNDISGNLSSSLIVNADVAAAAGIVDTKLATITTAGKVANSATTGTSSDVINTLVLRDGSGNFATNMITVDGTTTNATDVATKAYVDGAISGSIVTGANVGAGTGLIFRDKTGNNINFKTLVNGVHFALTNNANDITLATDATDANSPSTIVARDALGNFSAGTITANLNGNATTATTATSATNFTGSLLGDVTGTQGATVVSFVGGQSAANVATATVLANAATSLNTPSTIVKRDASGNFSAGTIIASLTGAASLNVLKAGDTMTGALQLPAGTTALPSLIFTGSTTTGLSANSGNLSFSTSALERMKISSAGTISIDAFTSAGIVHNDASGNLSSSLIVNADVAAAAGIIDSKLATISTAGKVLNSATTATSADTANAIVSRDVSGNFATNMITLDGTTTNATDAATKAYVDGAISSNSVTGANVGAGTGLIFRDKTGNNINFKTLVNGTHFALTNNANDITLATDATNTNTINTIVARDGTGSFAAQVVSVVDTVASGNLVLSASPSTSTAGNIVKGANSFIHNFGTNNTFVGVGSGNFTMSGTGQNSIFGASAFTATTTGANNTAIGYNTFPSVTTGSSNIAIGSGAGGTLTIGTGNIYINANAATGPEANTIRIGTSQTKCYIAGISGVNEGGPGQTTVYINNNGQLGTSASSKRYKHNINDMGDISKHILDLRPVTFAYNSDTTETVQYGLIAEEVDEVFPTIVVRNQDNEIESVQYHVLPVLLLNEMKKQHLTIEKMHEAIRVLQEQLQEFIGRVKAIENNA